MFITPPSSDNQLRPGRSDLNVILNRRSRVPGDRSEVGLGLGCDDHVGVVGSGSASVLSIETPTVVGFRDSLLVEETLVLVSDVISTADFVVDNRTRAVVALFGVSDGECWDNQEEDKQVCFHLYSNGFAS
jgi:hypothetical protein